MQFPGLEVYFNAYVDWDNSFFFFLSSLTFHWVSLLQQKGKKESSETLKIMRLIVDKTFLELLSTDAWHNGF